jgi:hypothetical protein
MNKNRKKSKSWLKTGTWKIRLKKYFNIKIKWGWWITIEVENLRKPNTKTQINKKLDEEVKNDINKRKRTTRIKKHS